MPERDNPPAHGPGWWVLVIGGITLALCSIFMTVLLVGAAAAVIFGVRTVPLPASPAPIVVTVQVTAAPRVITATPAAADLPLDWTLVMDEPFDDNANQWDEDTYSHWEYHTDYWIRDGSFQWVLTDSEEMRGYERCAACDLVEDSFVSVDATLVRLDAVSGFVGVMARQRYGATYYACLINDDAELAAVQFDGDSWQQTFLQHWQAHPAINPEGTNTIAIRAEGRELSCYVNGEWILTVTDGTLESGRPGVVVGFGPQGGTIEAHFDNFQVSVPPGQD